MILIIDSDSHQYSVPSAQMYQLLPKDILKLVVHMLEASNAAVGKKSIQVNHFRGCQADMCFREVGSLTASSVICVNDDCPRVEETPF